MAKLKAPIFRTEGFIDNSELLDQLRMAVTELKLKMQATISITNGGREVGFGVSKAQRGIAADAVISIAKAIKNSKGW